MFRLTCLTGTSTNNTAFGAVAGATQGVGDGLGVSTDPCLGDGANARVGEIASNGPGDVAGPGVTAPSVFLLIWIGFRNKMLS